MNIQWQYSEIYAHFPDKVTHQWYDWNEDQCNPEYPTAKYIVRLSTITSMAIDHEKEINKNISTWFKLLIMTAIIHAKHGTANINMK